MAKYGACMAWSPRTRKLALISCGTLVVLAVTATYLSSCRRRRQRAQQENQSCVAQQGARRESESKSAAHPGTVSGIGSTRFPMLRPPSPSGSERPAKEVTGTDMCSSIALGTSQAGAETIRPQSAPGIKMVEPASRGAENGRSARQKVQSIVSRYSGVSQGGIAPHNPIKQNQDAMLMAVDEATSTVLLTVLDGHGPAGRRVSQAFKTRLAEEAFSHPRWASSCETAITESIAKIEADVVANVMIDTTSSGTTLVSTCIRGTQLTVTNVGDSRAVLGRQQDEQSGKEKGSSPTTLVAQRLTEDHKPDVQREERRILAAGGRVFAVQYGDDFGPPRVWLGDRDAPGLAMSRSLGDSDAQLAGVTSESDVFRYDLADGGCTGSGDGAEARGEPEVLILASDGLWDVFSDQEAVDVVSRYVDLGEAISTLVKQARKRWLRQEKMVDDITVCIARFKTRSKWPHVMEAATRS